MNINLQNKLLNYGVTPPERVWKKIEESLDESEMNHAFPARLYHAEVIPPVAAWNRISGSLDEEQEPGAERKRKTIPLLKYAAAAAIIGLFALSGILLFNNKPGNKTVARKTLKQPLEVTPSTDPAPADNNTVQFNFPPVNNNINEEARNDAALEASKKTVAKLDLPVKNRIKEIAAGYYFAAATGNENLTGILPQDEANPGNISGRYITLITPEGNIIRMSKKLTDMVCCVSGEDENEDCKDLIKKWREKIICSPACHSAGSFIDILGLIDSLPDN